MANEFRKVTDQNGTNHPVCDDTRVDWSSYAVTGVHNILPIPSNVVSSGIFTVNRDSNGNVTSISVNGTPTADQDFNIGSASNPLPISLISNGDILSKGNELPDTELMQQIWYYDNTKTYLGYQNESTTGCSVNKIVINIPNGAAYFVVNNKARANKVLNVSLYPMIRLASDTNEDYVPYAMTNRELMESLDLGVLQKILFSTIWGTAENPINIDELYNDKGYMYRISSGETGFSGTAPSGIGGNAFILLGFSNLQSAGHVRFGVQVAIGFGSSKIAIRSNNYNASGAAWNEWKYLTAT